MSSARATVVAVGVLTVLALLGSLIFPEIGARGMVGLFVLGLLVVTAVSLFFRRDRGRDADVFVGIVLVLVAFSLAVWPVSQAPGEIRIVGSVLLTGALVAALALLNGVAARRTNAEVRAAGFVLERGMGGWLVGRALRGHVRLGGRTVHVRTEQAAVRGAPVWLVLSVETRAPVPVVRVSPQDGHGWASAIVDPFIPGDFRRAAIARVEIGEAAFDAAHVVQAEGAPEARRALTPHARAAIGRIFAARLRPCRTHVVVGPARVEFAIPLTDARLDRLRAAAVALAGLASHAEAAVGVGPLAARSPSSGAAG